MRKAIEIKDLSFSYPDGTAALRGVSLDIYENETVGLIGPNGAGKSTLLLHFNGLLSGSGSISIFALRMHKQNLKEIRRKIGLVFQDPHDQLFMPTVYEDVAFGPLNMGLPKADIGEAVALALDEVDMAESAHRLSHHLSFGEKKRVSIATVLSMRPQILVLDEPSSNLDPKHRRGLINLLKGLKLTQIIATHDLELVLEVCSRVILLDKGEIVAGGDVRDILGNQGLLEKHSLEVPGSLGARLL